MHIYNLLWVTNNVPTAQTAYLRFVSMLPFPRKLLEIAVLRTGAAPIFQGC